MNPNIKSIVKLGLAAVIVSALALGCGNKKDEPKPTAQQENGPADDQDKLPDGLTPEQAAMVVAKVGERQITVGDVTRQINRLSPYIRRRWAAPEKRKEFLEKLIRVELLSQEAERQGLKEDPEVQRTVKQVMIRLMVKNDLEKNLFPSKIEDDVLKQEYEKESDKYHRAAQVRASHIVLKNQGEAEKILADLKAHATDNRYFRQKAREVSLDEKTKDRGGDLGYFSKLADRKPDEPELPAILVETAWNLQNVGELADKVVKTDQGFHIVKLTNKRAEMNRSFDSVKRMIENRLLRQQRQEAMDKFIEELKSKAKIEIFKDNLAKLELGDDMPMGHPGMPRGMAPPKKGATPPAAMKKGAPKTAPKKTPAPEQPAS